MHSYITTAKLLIQRNNLTEAKKTLISGIEKNKKNGNWGYYENAEAYFLLGVLEAEEKNLEKMLEYFMECEKITHRFTDDIIKQKKGYWGELYNQGVKYYNAGELQQAKLSFEKALKVFPNDQKTINSLEMVLYDLGENSTVPKTDETKNAESNENYKDIDGYQIFKWNLSKLEVLDLIKGYDIWVDSLKKPFEKVTIRNFIFQEKEAVLDMEFYEEKLYRVSIFFSLQDNVAGMNKYFYMAKLIEDIYGKGRRVAIGDESDDYNHRVVQLSIGSLIYQYKWKSPSGELTFQLRDGTRNSFLCALYYSSLNADKLDDKKNKEEF